MRACVYGCGFPGFVSSIGLCERGLEVVAVDTDTEKIQQFREGLFWGGDQELEVLLNKHLQATLKFSTELPETPFDFFLLALPTPFDSGDLSTDTLVETLVTVLQKGRFKSHPKIIIRSTLPIGGLAKLEKQVYEMVGKRSGEDFLIGYFPEFMRQGTGLDDWYNPPLQLVATNHGEFPKKMVELFFTKPDYVQDSKIVEMTKLASNAFHALKVSFANEVDRLCWEQKISSEQVMDLFCKDHKLNISSEYLDPGFAWGGGCLGKDLNYLISQIDQLQVLQGTAASNETHVDHFAQRLIETGAKSIGFMGCSFKSGISDLRESPTIKLLETLSLSAVFDEIVVLESSSNKDFFKDLCNVRLVNTESELDAVEILVQRRRSKSSDLSPRLQEKKAFFL